MPSALTTVATTQPWRIHDRARRRGVRSRLSSLHEAVPVLCLNTCIHRYRCQMFSRQLPQTHVAVSCSSAEKLRKLLSRTFCVTPTHNVCADYHSFGASSSIWSVQVVRYVDQSKTSFVFLCSSVTKVGVTGCSWWMSPYFFLQKWRAFYIVIITTPTLNCKFSHKKILDFHHGVTPWMVSPGRPAPSPSRPPPQWRHCSCG